MFLDDVPVNYLAVLLAALAYFVIGAIWYAPVLFGNRSIKHYENETILPKNSSSLIRCYIGEFILSLILAYVLAVFIEISQADEIVEGVAIALWVWLGFIATTHFSAVLWDRKTLKSFFVHAGFMLIGLMTMGVIIMSF